METGAALDNGNGRQTGADLSEAVALKKRIRELEMENAHPKKGGAYLRARKLTRYQFIDAEKSHYPIKLVCRVMKVNRSRYYAYCQGKTYKQSSLKRDCALRVKECFAAHRRRYGTRRMSAELKIGRSTVRRIMRRENLRAIQPKSFTPKTTNSKHGLPICENLLQKQANAPARSGEVFVGDITYLPLSGGTFCYLACLQDKFTRRIVGWKVSERMAAQFVIDVFLQAGRRGLIKRNAIIHSNQGSQYASVEYRQMLYIGGFQAFNLAGRIWFYVLPKYYCLIIITSLYI